ncbi:kinase-like (PK-like) [Fusarium napiforme]|uniref:Kinase-like (PK-like) n=1 Tax=Fusarium napiforme TaxID=42672 RepID=A0A8H5N9P7_9HYPO|nr:kinase-like (PK-like) [Fusarium napiforme]
MLMSTSNKQMIEPKIDTTDIEKVPMENYRYQGNGLVTIRGGYDDLGKLLRDYCVEGVNGRFWTDKLLRHILSQERIKAELKRPEHGFDDRNVDKYVDIIHPPEVDCSADRTPPGAFLKVFALLVLQERCGDIRHFVNAGFNDQQLPIRIEKNAVYSLTGPSLPIACFEGWKTSEKEYFESYQWRIDTPYFSSTLEEPLQEHYLPKGVCKPWCRSRETPSESCSDASDNVGAFGTVIQVDIHPTSHCYQELLTSINLDCTKFAIKTLHNTGHDNESKFQEELKMLQRFNGLKHPHLVTALCAFRCGEERSFIFPSAICDLSEYMEKNEPPRHSKATIWISSQLLGLIGALRAIHSPKHEEKGGSTGYGRHGDIKCDNILCFKKLGGEDEIVLVLSEFGLSTLNSVKSRSNFPNHKVAPVPGYRPPECDIEGGTISRAFDIWTLGCLFLELITWFLGGPRYVEEFDQARTTMFINGANNNIFFAFKRRPDHNTYAVLVKAEVVEMLYSKCTKREGYVLSNPWTGERLETAGTWIRRNNIAVDTTPIRRTQALTGAL